MDWSVVSITVLSAIAYGLIFFAKAYMTKEPKPPFDPYKFLATMAVALLIGIVFAFNGTIFNEAAFLSQMMEWGFYVAMIETILKALVGALGKQWPTSFPNPPNA